MIVLGALAHPAFAQPKQKTGAAEHFNRGQAAQAEKRWRDAIAEYEQAHALLPHPNNLFNIAVCYEGLEEWDRAADYYERYLDEQGAKATDGPKVRAKIKDLRAKVVAPPPTVGDPWPGGGTPPPTLPPGGIIGVAPPVEPKPAKWHAGGTYGLGFGDVPVQRAQLFGGMRLAKRLDVDGVFGLFGKNDLAIGLLVKLKLARIPPMTPFLRAAATIGYAKQDDSSSAGTKVPLGLEAGGGLQLGSRGWLELSAVVRFVVGGWDSGSTMADSYVNDSIAFAIDLGFAFEIPFRIPSSLTAKNR